MASVLKVDKLDPQSGTALEIGTPSGATLDISSATLTPPATLPASSGVNLTALNASNLGSGTVPTARLGSGTASSSTVLYGDQTYKAEPGGGKILQVVSNVNSGPSTASTTSTSYVTTGMDLDITPSATSSKIFLTWTHIFYDSGSNNDEIRMTFYRDSTQLGDCIMSQAQTVWIPSVMTYVDSPSSTSSINYEAFFKSNQGNTVYGANASYNAVLTAWEIDGS
jgi:hypothetical protein